MPAERLRDQSGYSLVEVMVSIIILAVAILPMVGMFDMGLRSATNGSNYDKARTLANLKMEEAKSLTYATVKNSFPVTGSTPNTTTGYYDSGFIPESGPASAEFTNFEYRVQKQYMKQPDTTPTTPSKDFVKCNVTPNSCNASPTGPIRITVTVQWGDGNTYTIFGLVT
jgi:prepilin-type N-terminal cleavage/methylation domain-containing protein